MWKERAPDGNRPLIWFFGWLSSLQLTPLNTIHFSEHIISYFVGNVNTNL